MPKSRSGNGAGIVQNRLRTDHQHPEAEMTVRPPSSLNPANMAVTGLGILEYEPMSERASPLGHNGLKVEAALAALQEGEAKGKHGIEHERLVDTAAQAVWAMF